MLVCHILYFDTFQMLLFQLWCSVVQCSAMEPRCSAVQRRCSAVQNSGAQVPTPEDLCRHLFLTFVNQPVAPAEQVGEEKKG